MITDVLCAQRKVGCKSSCTFSCCWKTWLYSVLRVMDWAVSFYTWATWWPLALRVMFQDFVRKEKKTLVVQRSVTDGCFCMYVKHGIASFWCRAWGEVDVWKDSDSVFTLLTSSILRAVPRWTCGEKTNVPKSSAPQKNPAKLQLCYQKWENSASVLL